MEPAGTTTVLGETVARDVLLLTSEIVTPPGGALTDNTTCAGRDCPSPTVPTVGMLMDPKTMTVTVAFAPLTLSEAGVAPIVAVPGATPVTGTFTVVAPSGIVTLAGTVAVAVAVELRFTTRPPAGAGAETLRARFCVPPAPTVIEVGEKFRLAETVTVWVSPVSPGADAVMIAEPNVPPVT